MKSILSIDYGSKRLGLALKTKGSNVVFPWGVLENDKNVFVHIQKIINEEDIGLIVVGMPFGLDKKENQNTKRVRGFVSELKEIIHCPVEFVDERFTTAQAKRTKEKYSASVDEQSACIILSSYLEQK